MIEQVMLWQCDVVVQRPCRQHLGFSLCTYVGEQGSSLAVRTFLRRGQRSQACTPEMAKLKWAAAESGEMKRGRKTSFGRLGAEAT